MRHHDSKRKFHREEGQYTALMKSLVHALVEQEHIETTLAKARELRPMVEKMVTKAKANTLANRRLLAARIGSDESAKKLMTIATKYATRPGGYTRIVKLPRRKKDGSEMALISFVA
jgi:large subunit ribosomal protein L17